MPSIPSDPPPATAAPIHDPQCQDNPASPPHTAIQDSPGLSSEIIEATLQPVLCYIHPMIARAQIGSLKLKVFFFSFRHPILACFLDDLATQPQEPRTYKQALNDPKWQ